MKSDDERGTRNGRKSEKSRKRL
jgi:hypothetical protein